MKNTIKMVVGILLLFSIKDVGEISFTSSEEVDYSLCIILFVILGAYLVYSGAEGFRNENKKKESVQINKSN